MVRAADDVRCAVVGVPGSRESFHSHSRRPIPDESQRGEVIAALAVVLADVRRVVED